MSGFHSIGLALAIHRKVSGTTRELWRPRYKQEPSLMFSKARIQKELVLAAKSALQRKVFVCRGSGVNGSPELDFR